MPMNLIVSLRNYEIKRKEGVDMRDIFYCFPQLVGIVALFAFGYFCYFTDVLVPEAQPQIISEAKLLIEDNQNKDITTFAYTPNLKMKKEAQQEIINYAGEHGMRIVEANENRIIFEKK